ncbi:MAG: DUF4340 domain-containing protein [Chitinispirillales bacterium]|jgi:hypothetical protein|nr:DUF4340 domain-containing protein [Chitinispirillales bacterium]
MGNKKLIIAACAIVIAGAIFLISERVSLTGTDGRKALALFPTLTESSITAIVMSERGSSVRLEKIAGEWMVTGKDGSLPPAPDGDNDEDDDDSSLHPADEALVSAAIEQTLSMRKTDLVSNNPANQALFGVDTAGGMFVRIFTQDEATPAHTIIVGNPGPDWNSNYVRSAESDEVHLIPGNIRQALFMNIGRWKRPTLKPESEEEFEFELGEIEDSNGDDDELQ